MLELHRRSESLHLAPQNLVEFRNAATRPTAANGLGLLLVGSGCEGGWFEATLLLLPESPDIFPNWKSLVRGLGIIGKQVHDARLVAVCHVHSVSHVLTFNVRHFTRMATFGPGIVIVDASSF
jgi:hypothetical protein